MSLDYLSLKGLKKSVLHCASHSGSDVVGALTPNDSFPMFHSRVTTPIVEVVLNILKDENIIGFYESRIRSSDSPLEPSKLVLLLSQALKSRGIGQVFILCIDNYWQKESPLHLFTLTTNSYTKIYEYPGPVVTELKDFVLNDLGINDFDDHFGNIKADWKNLHIN